MKKIIFLIAGLNFLSTGKPIKIRDKQIKIAKKELSTSWIIMNCIAASLIILGFTTSVTVCTIFMIQKKQNTAKVKKILQDNPNLPPNIQEIFYNGFNKPIAMTREDEKRAMGQISSKLFQEGYIEVGDCCDKKIITKKSKLIENLNKLANKAPTPEDKAKICKMVEDLEKAKSEKDNQWRNSQYAGDRISDLLADPEMSW